MSKHYALFSGGHDSLVSTHIAMENGPATEVLHLDTNTGIEENLEFVKEVCEKYDWPLRVEESPMTLKEFAMKWGFPGPGVHNWAYRWFKERQLGRIATEEPDKPHYWVGVRKDESNNRMEYITQTGVVEKADRWVWHKPIAYLPEDKRDEYIRENELPKNPVVANIHRSGECYCGAYGTRDEELIDLQANYPEHFDWLKSVEDEVIQERGADDEKSYWANGSMDVPDTVALKCRRDKAGLLCSDCREDMHNSADETNW